MIRFLFPNFRDAICIERPSVFTTYGSIGSGSLNTSAVVNEVFNASNATSCGSIQLKETFFLVRLESGAAMCEYPSMRQYGTLLDANEGIAVHALYRRWSQVEQPLLLTAVFFQPKYRKNAIQMGLSGDDIGRFVIEYAKRWGSRTACGLDEASAMSVAAVIDAWCTRGFLD
jgi:hypothetical protein